MGKQDRALPPYSYIGLVQKQRLLQLDDARNRLPRLGGIVEQLGIR